jgi:metalloendopeptidase OMA1, mitochondrial
MNERNSTNRSQNAASQHDERTGAPAAVYPDASASSRRSGWGARRARFLLPLAALVAACVSVPITGRSAFVPFPVEQDSPLGAEAYDEILQGEQEIKSGPQVEIVNRVMDRLVAAAKKMNIDPGFDWEVRVLKADDVPNAWALPGGKMAVYTGILPITQNEAGLAVVMGHELSHAIARHGAERMGQQMVQSGLLEGVNILRPDWAEYAELGLVGFDLLVSRPWGRSQESEADHIGLFLMAEAGYDPREAVAFWERMSSMTGGGGGPEWLSTHPSHGTRIADIKALLPEVLPIYQGS